MITLVCTTRHEPPPDDEADRRTEPQRTRDAAAARADAALMFATLEERKEDEGRAVRGPGASEHS